MKRRRKRKKRRGKRARNGGGEEKKGKCGFGERQGRNGESLSNEE